MAGRGLTVKGERAYTVGHLFCGCGGGANGFHRARFGWRGIEGRFRTAFGVDVDPLALRAFERLSGGPGHLLDLFEEADYRAFHGKAPPAGWREVTVEDFRRLSPESPDVLFTSPPCVGLSRLISAEKAKTERYQAVNRLTLRGISLALSAWDPPPRIILFENVPGIAEKRGRHLLQQIEAELTFHGYSVGYSTHCLGDLGGLGARRPRFMLVARHEKSVPPHLFQPRPLGRISIGEAIGDLPMPGDPAGGPMHLLGRYKWLTWVRLALVPAGKDWRALKRLRVRDGVLQDYALVPVTDWHKGILGVNRWDESAPTVTTRAGHPTTGAHAVADPRLEYSGDYGQMGVVPWRESIGAVTAQSLPGGGRFSIEDPRLSWGKGAHTSKMRVSSWAESAGTIATATQPASGALSIADPRFEGTRHNNVFRVVRWQEPSAAITAGMAPTSGGLAISDPRSPWMKGAWSGPYGVVAWNGTAGAVTASQAVDNSGMAVADPRGLPRADDRGVYCILSEDGTWHRPMTRLEAAVLQGFRPQDMGLQVDGGRMVLEGSSSTAWQRLIGNAVPPAAAERIAEVVGRCLLQADAGETFLLSSEPHWAQPLATALSVRSPA